MRLKSVAYDSMSAVPWTLCRVRFLAGGAASVDLRFLSAVEATLRGATVARGVAGLCWAF